MKKSIICIIFIIFATSVFGQDVSEGLKTQIKTFKNKGRFNVKYDKFEDKTTVVYQGNVLNGTMSFMASGVMIQLHAAYGLRTNGEKPFKGFLLFFKTFGSNFAFLKNQTLFILADDKRIEMGEGSRDSNIGRGLFGETRINEIVAWEISEEQLEILGNAKSLEIKLGGKEFKIKDDDKEAFLNLIKLSK